MNSILLILALACSVPTQRDTLAGSYVTAFKQVLPQGETPSPMTSLMLNDIEGASISDQKALSLVVPNLSIPDYGSSMTSSIYMRGFGSRIDNPVMGLYVDDIPILNKNSYEFPFVDIRRIDITRGPQGTLYGRNSMAGILSVETLTPSVYQGIRASVEFGSASTFSTALSIYKENMGVSLHYKHSDGFFTNEYNGNACDRYDGLGARVVSQYRPHSGLFIDNILSMSFLRQGGYPYRRLVGISEWNEDEGGEAKYGGALLPVNYNDECSYKRINVTDGVKVRFFKGNWQLNSVSSVQLLFDKMLMDQDFTTKSMFTLEQKQHEYALTQEFVLKPVEHPLWWNHQSGFFGFFKYNDTSAPVLFKQDGIRSLILDSANAGIPDYIGPLKFRESEFPISSDFGVWTYGLALYHESYFHFGDFRITAGLRLDHEGDFMRYDSRATVNFSLDSLMHHKYKAYTCTYKGSTSLFYWKLLPKVAVSYDVASAVNAGDALLLNVFATVSRGYKAGGFNTQLFSDILQNRMKNGMMESMGIYPGDDGYNASAGNTTYKPETCMDYELGFKSAYSVGSHSMRLSASAFYMDCNNQQVTVFPSGNGTGRMMANAGRSRSLGVEVEAGYEFKGLSLAYSYGLTDAKFTDYDNGQEDYSGNVMPYSPRSTMYMSAAYSFVLRKSVLRSITVQGDCSRFGRIMWNESNTLEQSPYFLIGAGLSFSFKWFELFANGFNLADTGYETFYFRSVGNDFFQSGKPRRWNAGIRMAF